MECMCKKEFHNEKSLKGHKATCCVFQNFLEVVFLKEGIEKWFSNGGTANQFAINISKKYNISIQASSIIRFCKKREIKTLSIKEACGKEEVKNKRNKTNLEKYGKINCLSYGTIPFLKRNNTVKEKYGVNNVFQLENVKLKSCQTLKKKYGVEYPTFLPRIKNVGKRSVPHMIVEKWLNENNISFVSENVKLNSKRFNKELNRNYKPVPDIYIEEISLIIEIYGDRWHANPDSFFDDDLIYTWRGEITAEKIRNFNRIREEHLNECGYSVIVLWASKIARNNSTKIKNCLLKEINEWKNLKLNQLENFKQKKRGTIYL